eukprot:3427021-Amphidinium_carterae.1
MMKVNGSYSKVLSPRLLLLVCVLSLSAVQFANNDSYNVIDGLRPLFETCCTFHVCAARY